MRIETLIGLILLYCRAVALSGQCADPGEQSNQCGANGKNKPDCEDYGCSGIRCGTPTTTTTGATTSTSAATDDPGACPYVSLKTLCIAWVRGNSKKLHVLAKVGGVLADGTEVPINGADVVYSTKVDGQYNSEVETTTDTYVFKGYQGDFENACEEFMGATGNANCFETAPEDALCEVKIESITYPGCPEATFDATDDSNTESCVFGGKYAPSPSTPPCKTA